jgi:hypothetical protein
MVNFDWQTAVASQGQGGDLLGSIGAGYGAPACLTDLTGAVLGLLPMPVLAELNRASEEVQARIDSWFDGISETLSLELGINITITSNGKISITSRNSSFGMGLPGLGALGEIAGFVNGMASLGAGLYATAMQGIENFEAMKSCIENFFNQEKMSGTNSSEARKSLSESDFNDLVEAKYAPYLAELDAIRNARDKWKNWQDEIQAEMAKRIRDPSLEPILDCSLEGIGNLRTECVPVPEEELEVIRLVHGPPVAREGQFLLSNDGLYYDAQSPKAQGLTQVLNHISKKKSNVPLEHRWKFEHDPNLGGKGVAYSSKSVKYYVDTMFDPNIIDDSISLRKFYDKDHFLKTLEGQKAKMIHDVSGNISELERGNAGAAIIQNTKQALYSEMSTFTKKINKRKKQIEIAHKIPSLYGSTALFKPGDLIPINDFSYLQQFNFANDIRKQKALVLDQGDVSGSVLPITPIFVTSEPLDEVENREHLLVAEVGRGDILFTDTASGTEASKLSVTTKITDSGLFAMYNFLESDVVDPSSNTFNITNCSLDSVHNDSQLISTHTSSVYFSGLGIPYFEGACKFIGSAVGDPTTASGPGSVLRLPESTEFNDMTYAAKGFTAESWMYVPHLTDIDNGWVTDAGTSGNYRLWFGNENTGLDSTLTEQSNPERLEKDLGGGAVKGMIVGFTRDRRITKGLDHIEHPYANEPTSSLAFFAAPTQAVNDTSVGLIHNGCKGDVSPNWLSFSVDASTTNAKGQALLLSACDNFVLVSLSVNPSLDKITLYVNGEYLFDDSLNGCFGRELYESIQAPSFVKPSSFSYSGTNVGTSAASLSNGPFNGYFTPTMVGGGYTDGMTGKGFMGSSAFGTTSGLRGYLGSLKFYNKALLEHEVLANYNAQKDVFENVPTPSTHIFGGGH